MIAATLAKNLVCMTGAVAVSLTFMSAAAGPAQAASPVARLSFAALNLSTPARQLDRRSCLASTIDDAMMLAPTRA